MANSSKTELWQQSPRVWAGGSPGMSHCKDSHRPTGKRLCPKWIIANRGLESLCRFCQWGSGLQFHSHLLRHVYIAYLACSLDSGALAWQISWLIAASIQISTQPARSLLRGGNWEPRGGKEQFLNPSFQLVLECKYRSALHQLQCRVIRG